MSDVLYKQVHYINFGFYTYTPMCVSTVCSVPESCETTHRGQARVEFEPTTLVILEQCHTNYTCVTSRFIFLTDQTD